MDLLIASTIVVLLLPAAFFGVPRKALPWFILGHGLLFSMTSGWIAAGVLMSGPAFSISIPISFWGSGLDIYVDALSAFFILVINFTVLTGEIFALRYLDHYTHATVTEQRLHLFSLAWLHLSMVLVTVFQSVFAFLLVWEIMAVSSFILVLFDSESRDATSAGIKYLVQMHIGALLILFGFLVLNGAGLPMDFRSLTIYFSQHTNWPLALLFFVGFGIKAGFIPFHTWLPHAHPAAPSHVSGIMSGVMIKLGIYGMLRVILHLRADFIAIGSALLILSILSALLGVIYAIIQHDLKRLLAFHSIENIGIIGIGMGLGVVALGLKAPILGSLAFAGALLHVFNHSLFKSLLFYAAGGIQFRTHTLNLERLGGLIQKMPQTACLFLIGAAAISGLPPLNGFISEILIYTGLIQALGKASVDLAVILLAGVTGLALVGGLAVFCFTKAFGVIFLGSPRSKVADTVVDAPLPMRVPMYVVAALILAVGLAPAIAVQLVLPATSLLSHSEISTFMVDNSFLLDVGMAGVIFLVIVFAVFLIRRYVVRAGAQKYAPTWGCGYEVPNPRMQYTASSYASGLVELAAPVVDIDTRFEAIEKSEFFPKNRTFATHPRDMIEHKVLIPSVRKLTLLLQRIGIIQTGHIHHYVLYAFVYMLLLLTLTFFGVLG